MSEHVAYFRCFYKVVTTTRAGSPMLAARLVDAQQQWGAVAFGAPVFGLARRFTAGDVVRVVGRPGVYRGKPQLRMSGIDCVSRAPATAIVPRPMRDVDELRGFARHFTEEVSDPGFSRLLFRVLERGDGSRLLAEAPATTFSHHAYVGGLLEHTVAVASLCAEMCGLHAGLDHDLLLTAALVHDLGRAHVYPRDDYWTRPGRDPLAKTLELLWEAAEAVGLSGAKWRALRDTVAYGVGRDVGARPPSAEAVALRGADALDSSVGDAKRRRRGRVAAAVMGQPGQWRLFEVEEAA